MDYAMGEVFDGVIVTPPPLLLQRQGFWPWKRRLQLEQPQLATIPTRFSFSNKWLALQEIISRGNISPDVFHAAALDQLQQCDSIDGRWQFLQLPAYNDRESFISDLEEEQVIAVQEAFRIIDQRSSDYHNTMLDIGAKHREAVYANQPLSVHILGIYQ